MKSRELLLAVRDMLATALADYPFPCPDDGLAAVAVGESASRTDSDSGSLEHGVSDQLLSSSVSRYAATAESDVRVFLHGLPDAQDDKTYPFVVVRWVEGRIEEGRDGVLATEIVGMVIGVYAPKNQEQAGIYSAALMDAVRQIVWRARLLARLFDLVPPLRSAIPAPDKRWNQYHMATVEAEFNYRLPSRAMGKDGAQWREYTEMMNP